MAGSPRIQPPPGPRPTTNIPRNPVMSPNHSHNPPPDPAHDRGDGWPHGATVDDPRAKLKQRTADLFETNAELSRQVSARLRAEAEAKSLRQQLLLATRRASMAETATDVLHNVGNVLTSISVSATEASQRVNSSHLGQLVQAIQLLKRHSSDLAGFLTSDPQGQQLAGFLPLVTARLLEEQQATAKELELLLTKLAHVKAVLATQQSTAGSLASLESVDIAATLNDALELDLATFDQQQISLQCEIADLPLVLLDRQKLLQILINLLKNAMDSLAAARNQDRRVVFRAWLADDQRLMIEVEDNGLGIPSRNLRRIFEHGFTTKQNGHGFGLHGCMAAAKEMGGNLRAHSNGENLGATFTLDLPCTPVPSSPVDLISQTGQ